MIADLRKQEADIVILLSSLSLEENILLGGSVGGIHAILGGASREELHETLFIEGPDGWETILGQAGAYGAFVGRLALAVEGGKTTREKSSWSLLRVTPQTEPDRAVMALAMEYEQKLNEVMLQSIGFFSDPADARSLTVRTREAALGNLITDALRWRFKTDIGIINAGGIRSDRVIPAGSVYRRILDEILPFENEIHIVRLTGRELRQVFEISASALVGRSGDSYDPSVRTHSGGFLQVSGIRVTYALSGEPTLLHPEGSLIRWGNRVRSLTVERNGRWMPVEDYAVYTVAANSWTAGGGDRYFVLRDAPQEKTGFRDIDVLADYIASHPGGRVNLSTDGRIRILFPKSQ
jgi:5'-nucleotidase